MTTDLVSVGKLTVNCAVARDHPHPERVRWRLDDVVAGPLHAALAALLEPLARLHSDEVVIIRRLELSFDLDTSRDVPELARRWAARLAEQLAFALGPEARTTQLRFADEARYLARFLLDTATGRADGKWYYRRFAGWAALPLPAILRSAIVDEPRRGLAALRALAPAELSPVLAALGAREARRIVETIIDDAGAGDDDDGAAAALVQASQAFHATGLAPASPWLVALALTALAAEAHEPGRLPSLARLAAAVAAWWVESARTAAGDGAMARAHTDTTVARTALGEAPPDLTPLGALAPSRRKQLEAALRPQAQARPGADATTAAAHTRFGGMLLLLPRLAHLPIERVFSGARDRALARLIVLARCAGPQRRRQAQDDPLLQRLCGLGDEGTTAGEVHDWITSHTEQLARELAPAVARARLSMTRSVGWAVARAPALGAVGLSLSEPDGYWLTMAPLSPSLRADLRSMTTGGERVGALTPAPAGDDAPALDGARDLRLATARALSRVLGYLAADDHATPLEAELALVPAAQHLLHGFARTLPGFAESTPPFLYDNFLAFSAIVEELGARRICRMGRPPLATLLALTGAQRGRVELPWLGGAGLELHPGG